MSSSVALPQIFSSPESLIGEISFYLTPLSLHLFRMDQAASIFGVPNHALHISFYPKLKAIPTRLPDSDPSHAWVIANTLVVSDKKVSEVYDSREKKSFSLSQFPSCSLRISISFLFVYFYFPLQVSGPVQYNLRVAELSMAVYTLSKALNLTIPQNQAPTLKNLLELYFSSSGNGLDQYDKEVKEALDFYGEEGAKIVQFRKLVEQILPKEEIDREKVEELTGFKGKQFEEVFMTKFPSEF